MPDLETVDLVGVEILSTGGPVRAIGSPVGGDFWTPEQLRAMVDAARELGDELKAPARIGHRKMGEAAEAALRSSPAVGWLTNHRLNADGSKYLADIKRVPKRFADLIRAGAYRTRSSELSKYTSQKTGKNYDYVVSGLAWLGDQLPAVQTLDDVVALYEGDQAEQQLLAIYENEKAPDSTGELMELVLRTLAGDLEESVPGSDEAPADTRPMGKYTDEQRTAFAKATGLANDKVTDELLANAGVAETTTGPAVTDEQARELAQALGVEVASDQPVDTAKLLEAAKAKGDSDSERRNEQQTELERRLQAAEQQAQTTAEELRVERRNSFVEETIKEGKIAPGAREKLERLYDKDPEGAREFVTELRPDEDLIRTYGSDDDSSDQADEEREKQERAYIAQTTGVPLEQVV